MTTSEYETQKKFNLQEMPVLIEARSDTDSAFGVNEQGEEVFFSSRLVKRMDVREGDEVVAHCVTNYQEMKSQTPWRCIKIS